VTEAESANNYIVYNSVSITAAKAVGMVNMEGE
jgi:hypothetical protein